MVQISVRTRAGIRVRRRDPHLSAIKTHRCCALHREMAGDELVRAELAHNRLFGRTAGLSERTSRAKAAARGRSHRRRRLAHGDAFRQ